MTLIGTLLGEKILWHVYACIAAFDASGQKQWLFCCEAEAFRGRTYGPSGSKVHFFGIKGTLLRYRIW